MLNRRFAFRVALGSAALVLLSALFLPVAFLEFRANGGGSQYFTRSLLDISPGAAALIILAIVLTLSVAIFTEPRRQSLWIGLVGGVLFACGSLAAAYTFSPIAVIGLHPAGMSAVTLSGLCLIVAAWVGRGYGPNSA